MENSWFTGLRCRFEAEVEAEFASGFTLWRLLPESRTAKAIALLTMHDCDLVRWKAAIKTKCATTVSQLRNLHTRGARKNIARSDWDNVLAGDGAVWGKVSVFQYLDYGTLKEMALRASSPADIRDGVSVPDEEFMHFRNLLAPRWKTTAECIRQALIERLFYVETRPWEDLAFEKRFASAGYTLRVTFGRIRSGFGFDYNVSLLPQDSCAFQASYERTVGIGVGTWDRVATDNVQFATETLVAVLTRLEAILAAVEANEVKRKNEKPDDESRKTS